MTPHEYQIAASRTAPDSQQKRKQEAFRNAVPIDLEHAIIGLVSEVGEIADALKRHVFYGKELDIENLKEEAGDLFWYLAIYCNSLGLSMEEVMKANIDKLKHRYPEKFTERDALERKDKQE